MKTLIDYLSNLIGDTIINYTPLSGGDISSTFKLESTQNTYFLKINASDDANAMFLTEKQGLETIAKTKTIATPKVIYCGTSSGTSFLVMEFIDTKIPSELDFALLGEQLANLHNETAKEFGFDKDNYIGSLSQSNNKKINWTEFYLQERIIPQLQLALSKNLLLGIDIPKIENMYEVCNKLFKDIKPSLLHGDLWGGNFLIAKNGTPYLIDPAVYYGHNEVDIAMSKLFGGFGLSFYKSYKRYFLFTNKTTARIDLYQLYYLLVHLNIFGSSYAGSVKRIVKNYF